MAINQSRSLRKPTGGRLVPYRKEKQHERGSNPTLTRVDKERKLIAKRTSGGNIKHKIRSAQDINVVVDGKAQKTTIETVLENIANPNLVRRNILTKGAIVQTKLGKVRITSRPGQDAVLNGVLVK